MVLRWFQYCVIYFFAIRWLLKAEGIILKVFFTEYTPLDTPVGTGASWWRAGAVTAAVIALH